MNIILKNLIVEISLNAFLVSVTLSSVMLNTSINLMYGTSSSTGLSTILLLIICGIWMRDIVEESWSGNLTSTTQKNLLIGFVLFIISEVVLFMTIFFSYFYVIIIRSVFSGGVWRRVGVLSYTFNGIRILNVLILFFSGALVTASLDSYKRVAILKNLTICIVLGVIFIMIQYIEFSTAKFTISDSLYGTVFFSLTGLLGILMIFGVTILVICWYRIYMYDRSLVNLLVGSINLLLLDILFIFIYIFVYCN